MISIHSKELLTPEEGKRLSKDALFLMNQNINPNILEKEEKRKLITLSETLASYKMTRKNLSKTTLRGYGYTLDKYLSDWANMPISSISKDMVVARHAMLGEYTANGTMRVLRLLVNHANALYDLEINNPVVHLSKIKTWFPEKRRITYIKTHQLPAWWKAVHNLESDTARVFLITLLFTGLRKGEAERLRWCDVDFDDQTITITKTKNGDVLTLPLSNYLYQLIHRRFQQYNWSEFVFPGTGKDGHLIEPKKSLYFVTRETGIQFTCHDLRRTFITFAESLDLPYYALKRLLNHRTSDVTGGYIIIDAERLREPVERIAEHILEITNDGKK
ncbi:MAG: tyrosine-type recombinase/integrase [Alphaproteobacteria bacterium]|nr:tyrosine-type recombinase/integrase [Alphaproteobacteria bacterium]